MLIAEKEEIKMRIHSNQTLYISDLLTVPMPAKDSSRQAYLRKLQLRRILCTLLPFCLEAAVLVLALILILAGIFAIGLGG